MRMILNLKTPPGDLTSTISFTLRPMMARPTGLSLLMRPLAGSASEEPTRE